MTLTERIAKAQQQPVKTEQPKPVEMPEWRRRMLEGVKPNERYLARKDTTVQ
jgi:hypothetical protein